MTLPFYQFETIDRVCVLRMISDDGMNRLTREKVVALEREIRNLASAAHPWPLIIAGEHNFSVGADLNEIGQLSGSSAFAFAKLGQALMEAIASYPATVMAAIEGHCMGGGLDLALACHRRIATTHAVFGHRGAALGLVTGWGGTQRLPRLVGKGRALELFVAAEKVTATRALQIGLVEALTDDPLKDSLKMLRSF